MLPWICRIPSLRTSRYLHRFPIFPTVSLVSFSTSTPKISIFDYLVTHHQLSPKCASNVSSSSTTKFLTKPKNADSVLNFLKETGFSENQIAAILQKSPKVLSSKLESTIKPKIKVFQELGFHSTDVAEIISTSPWFLCRSCDFIRLSIVRLKNALAPTVDICKFLKNARGGWILIRDFDRTLVANIEYLKSCGICPFHIAGCICNFPMTFLINPDKLKDIVERVDEMGVHRDSKMFLYAIKAMSSMTRENWELKLKLFRELGFSEQNILHAFRIQPPAFVLSERKIREVTQLLLSVENLDISYIVSNPQLLSYSVEKRLKPRLRVLKALESKNLLKKKSHLTAFFQITDAKFMNKYVIPYSDVVGDLHLGSQGSKPIKSVLLINNS